MKITVITVSRNSEATIASTMRSVSTQTYQDIEHIVVDGCSTDQTLALVRRFKERPGTVISESDDGMYDAMNKAIAMASGDVIGFLNSDDFFYSSVAVEHIALALSDRDIDACYGDLCYVDRVDTRKIVRFWRSSEFRPGMFLHGWCPAHPTFYVRRRVFERFGAFDLRYQIAADVELMARFMEVNRIRTRYLRELLVNMRMGGATNRTWLNIVRQNREIWTALKSHGLSPSLSSFLTGKVLSRGRQYFARPV